MQLHEKIPDAKAMSAGQREQNYLWSYQRDAAVMRFSSDILTSALRVALQHELMWDEYQFKRGQCRKTDETERIGEGWHELEISLHKHDELLAMFCDF